MLNLKKILKISVSSIGKFGRAQEKTEPPTFGRPLNRKLLQKSQDLVKNTSFAIADLDRLGKLPILRNAPRGIGKTGKYGEKLKPSLSINGLIIDEYSLLQNYPIETVKRSGST